MRIPPNQTRLRIVALVCWSLGAWWILQPTAMTAVGLPPILSAGGVILAALLLAIGVAFWLIAADHRAGVSFDRKGLSLHLGYSSAFIGWENIATLGVTRRRSSLLALGSQAQLGIRLHSPEQYLQSYEARLPASAGPLSRAVRLVERVTGGEYTTCSPDPGGIEALRRRTGYDIVIPEAQLGARAAVLIALLDAYRSYRGPATELPVGVD